MAAALSLSACRNNDSGSNGPAGQASKAGAAQLTSVDGPLVAGAIPTALTATSPRTVSAAVPQIPLARNLSQALEVVRERMLRQAGWNGATSVDITSRYLAVSTDVIGVEVRAKVTAGGRTTTTPAALWYDATLSQTFSSSVLISWPGWDAFATAVGKQATAQGLDGAKAMTALQQSAAPYGDGPAMGFAADGRLIVSFPPGVLGADFVQVVLDKDVVSPLLSDYGAKAAGASNHPSAFTGTPSTTAVWYKTPKDRPKASESPNLHPLPGDSTATAKSGESTPSASPSGAAKKIQHPSTAVGIDCIVTKAVALTYDDGPAAGTTHVIDAFNKVKGAATFFEMGNSIDEFPKTPRFIAASGFEIGNHTVTHPDLTTLKADSVQRELAGNSAKIKGIIGRAPLLFRPPYGAHNATVDKIADSLDMAVVNWSIDTEDWKTRNTRSTEQKVLKDAPIYTEPVTLMHDIHASTINAVTTIVNTLTEKGYTLVTISELTLNTGGLKAGHGYCRGTSLVQDGYLCKG
ncbi:MAG: polysaccharide deacetylase family protein [Acidipropionibacterium sp.]|jgi:peptidoglycan/xylan/chitin deacetylase (PgdA/CDA1 family)|nr:polysaccharide deacetylase family protein [Acidipropionibacterium sp.]